MTRPRRHACRARKGLSRCQLMAWLAWKVIHRRTEDDDVAWVKLDDGFTEHPKVLAAGPLASWLWVCGLAWCNRQRARDGFIPCIVVQSLCKVARGTNKLAQRLVEVGLWEVEDGGYRIHDYADYQPPPQSADSVRAARSLAGRVGGLRSGEARRKQAESVEANLLQANEANEASRPDPVPDPDRSVELQNTVPPDRRARDAEESPFPPAENAPEPDDGLGPLADPVAELSRQWEALWRATKGHALDDEQRKALRSGWRSVLVRGMDPIAVLEAVPRFLADAHASTQGHHPRRFFATVDRYLAPKLAAINPDKYGAPQPAVSTDPVRGAVS